MLGAILLPSGLPLPTALLPPTVLLLPALGLVPGALGRGVTSLLAGAVALLGVLLLWLPLRLRLLSRLFGAMLLMVFVRLFLLSVILGNIYRKRY